MSQTKHFFIKTNHLFVNKMPKTIEERELLFRRFIKLRAKGEVEGRIIRRCGMLN